MNTSLAHRRPLAEVLQEKTGLLTAALKTRHGKNHELDQQTVGELVGHVIRTRGLNQTSTRDMSLAEAVVMVSLNFALDFVSDLLTQQEEVGGVLINSEQTKAAAAVMVLDRNSWLELYAFAEKHFAEITARAEKLLKLSILTINDGGSRRRYDLLNKETYETLAKWATGELSDYSGLPPATKAEENSIVQRLDEIETELKLARNVRWGAILSTQQELTKFSASLFQRNDPNTYSSVGSVWQAFLLSLMAKILSNSWCEPVTSISRQNTTGVELFVFTDTVNAARFIALLLLEPEKLDDKKAIEVAAKISQVAFRPKNGIFTTERTKNDVRLIRTLAGERLAAFVHEAVRHYITDDVEKPTEQELDRFTRTRLFVYIRRNQDERLASAKAQLGTPWTKVSETKNLDELLSTMVGFADWPLEERDRLAEIVDLNRMVGRMQKTGLTTAADRLADFCQRVKGVKNGEEILAQLIKKNEWNPAVVISLGDEASLIAGYPHEVRLIVSRVNWTGGSLCRFARTTLFKQIGELAIRPLAKTLTLEEWRSLIEASRCHGNREGTYCIWKCMTPEQRSVHLLFFTGTEVRRFFLDSTSAEMAKTLEPFLSAAGKSNADWTHFETWQRLSGYDLLFEGSNPVSGGFIDVFTRLIDKYRPRK